MFSGIKASRLEEIFDEIPLVNGAAEFVSFLQSRDFLTSIVTDSYVFLAFRLAQKLGIKVVRGNKLELVNGIVSGKVAMPLGWKEEKRKNCQKKAVCKLHVMKDLIKEYSIRENRTLAVGDSRSDLCIIQEACIGVAFRPKDKSITGVADLVIRTDFYELIELLEEFSDGLGNKPNK